ncbi:MAG: nuclear transport factor 2 family protein [Caulobacter sp.]|nr:nuclear transport factor 2 family protein [Caulobacter sp.]
MTCDIHDLITALEAAWNRKDAVAFAACFDRSAEFGAMLDGSCRGRDAIEAAHATLFTGVYAVSVVTYRLMAAEPMGDWAVAIDLEQHLDFEVDGAAFQVRSRPQLVVRREGEGWTISTFANRLFEGAPAMPAPASTTAPTPLRAEPAIRRAA